MIVVMNEDQKIEKSKNACEYSFEKWRFFEDVKPKS